MQTVLIVDDEPRIVALARDYLEHDGFTVISASDGLSALRAIRERQPDLLVLDLGLPGPDGLKVARVIRRYSTLPIIMLTARDGELSRILGLEIGADDYMTKPFSPRELAARVRAVLRRVARAAESADQIKIGELTIEVTRRQVEVSGRTVELTPTEFALLVALARASGRVLTRSQLLATIGGLTDKAYERAIDAHVKNLRHKLEPDPASPRYVLTVYGVGYRFAEEPL
jgi:DNA-binding response OmpR family regulator